MGVADDDAGAKDREAGESDAAHGIFLHAHYADIAKPAMGRASCGRKQAKLGDSGFMAAPRKGTDDTELESLQFFFAPAHRSLTHSDAAHGTCRTLVEDFAGKGSGALGKFRGAGVKDDIAHPRSRGDGLSGDHYHFPALRNCQQLGDGSATHLPSATEDNHCEILIHEYGILLGSKPCSHL